MKSIAILYASEGTGHKAAAENLRDWFLVQGRYGNVICRDVLDYLPSWLHYIVSNAYLFMARHAPWAWGWFYWGSDKPSLQTNIFDWFHALLCKIYLPGIERDVYSAGAEAVFFTHYFGAPYFAQRNMEKIPVYYVNTDFICHRFQRDKAYRMSFVASPAAVKQHVDEGIDNVFDSGIPISPKFSLPSSKESSARKLGLDTARKTILVSGGGIGAGSVIPVTGSLAQGKDWQIVVICGNNMALYKKLSSEHKHNAHIRIEGFVSNIEDYYNVADLGIMKPGGLSLSEALAAKLPLILMDPIPGQEQLNMDYLVDLGAAIALKEAKTARIEAKELLANAEKLSRMVDSAEKICRPLAALNILDIADRISRAVIHKETE